MTKLPLAAAAAVLLTACSHAPSPAVGPVPATQTSMAEPPPAPRVAGQQPATKLSAPAQARQKADSGLISASEVTRGAVAVFGDSGSVAQASASDAGPSWDIDVHSYESTARVEHYVQLFTGRAKDHIESQLQRGTKYEAMIRGKMREGGLPEDMYYLAMIESGFDPNAYSRAAAVGMWQFMTSTGRDMGLRVDWWVDERRDPVKSTTAAVRFIKGLKEQFGSLYLAAAAYNGGPGRVARGLTRYADDLEGTSGDDLFFALAEKDYLRNETREYVPQLIAAALIAKEPERYGLSFTSLAPLTFDSVLVGPATPMTAIAHAANAQLSDLMGLNPQVLRGITPPKDSFFVRVPVGAADSFAVAFANLPKSERLGVYTVTSKKSESFATIGRREGISPRQLSLYNPTLRVLKSGNLAPGQSVIVPTSAVASAATIVPDPAIERYSSSRPGTSHVVKSGETLSGIAKKYHTTSAVLMKRNGLKRALIFPGQTLAVAAAPSTSKASAKKAGTKASAKAPAARSTSVKAKTAKKAAPATHS